jgi:hypothetical protein
MHIGKENIVTYRYNSKNFLSVYDPELRKKRGVWYTPKAVELQQSVGV